MKLQKITKLKNGFVYLYGINSREDFLRAGVKVATNRDYLLTGLTFISSKYGIVVLNSDLKVLSCEVWETEDDITKVSYLTKSFPAFLSVSSDDPETAKAVIGDVLELADDELLSNFLNGLFHPFSEDSGVSQGDLIEVPEEKKIFPAERVNFGES